MATHHIILNGQVFRAQHGERLLDAALRNGIDTPFQCRAGHCGTCCVRLLSGEVAEGHGAEPGVFHACQARIIENASFERFEAFEVRTVDGVLRSLRPLSPDVMQIGIETKRAFPYRPGQYAELQFSGSPIRPYSITHPIARETKKGLVWFHMRRMENGRVTGALGRRIQPGHAVQLRGPFGAAHFRPAIAGRLVLVATNTGFAPIWSIAAAALRENPQRSIFIVVGSRRLESLYMAPALADLARFPNVGIVPVCSSLQRRSVFVLPGRPTDYLPQLVPTDVVYACGAVEMVDAIRMITAKAGAICYADPFLPASDHGASSRGLGRVLNWLTQPSGAKIMRRPALRTPQQPPPLADKELSFG